MRLNQLPDRELQKAANGAAQEVLQKRERKRREEQKRREKHRQEEAKRRHIQSLSVQQLQKVAEDPRTMNDSQRREVWGYVYTMDAPNMGKDEAVSLARQELQERSIRAAQTGTPSVEIGGREVPRWMLFGAGGLLLAIILSKS